MKISVLFLLLAFIESPVLIVAQCPSGNVPAHCFETYLTDCQFRDPTNCQQFLVCNANGIVLHTFICGGDLQFDINGYCVPPPSPTCNNATSIRTAPLESLEPVCPSNVSQTCSLNTYGTQCYYFHSNCSYLSLCIYGGIEVVFACPPNQQWASGYYCEPAPSDRCQSTTTTELTSTPVTTTPITTTPVTTTPVTTTPVTTTPVTTTPVTTTPVTTTPVTTTPVTTTPLTQSPECPCP